MNPRVSVIIPTYNRADYIKKALDSVFLQTFQDFEIIVIDDGSTDHTKEVLEPYLQDSRVKYLWQQNLRVSRARNNGIRHSGGEYIALLDSDDFWLDKEKLEKQVRYFDEHPDCVLTSGGIVRADESGRTISKTLNPETDQSIRRAMLMSCLFAPSAAMFRRKDFDALGGFNEQSDLSEDWQLFLDLGKRGTLYNFQDYFLSYLQGSQNRSNFNRRHNLAYNLSLISRYRRDYPHFYKAYAIHFCYYLYSFLPFKNQLLRVAGKIKRTLFGPPAYTLE